MSLRGDIHSTDIHPAQIRQPAFGAMGGHRDLIFYEAAFARRAGLGIGQHEPPGNENTSAKEL